MIYYYYKSILIIYIYYRTYIYNIPTNINNYNVVISFNYIFLLLSFYLTIIIITSFNNNNNNFININDFNSEDKRADIKESNDDNADLILLLSNTLLKTIKEEEKDNKFELSLKLKKRLKEN